jgi:hypothetical protein
MVYRLMAGALLVCSLALSGCEFQLIRGSDPPDEDVLDSIPLGYVDPELKQLANEIARVVRTEARRPSSCKAAPIGAKPCGGPWSYLVYSSSSTNEPRLLSLISKYDARQAYLNRKHGAVSDCAYVSAPRVHLEGGHCRRAEPHRR